MEVSLTLPAYIRQRREAAGWNQTRAGALAGLSQKTWSRIETGQRCLTPAEVRRICDAVPWLDLAVAATLLSSDALRGEAA